MPPVPDCIKTLSTQYNRGTFNGSNKYNPSSGRRTTKVNLKYTTVSKSQLPKVQISNIKTVAKSSGLSVKEKKKVLQPKPRPSILKPSCGGDAESMFLQKIQDLELKLKLPNIYIS